MTNALADACIHAARSSNGLLAQLWIDGGMAIFGYFDSHYLFSSTIILMMSSILRNSDADRDAVETASDIMQSMVKDGNLPAAGFYQHFCEIRKILLDFNEPGRVVGGTTGMMSPPASVPALAPGQENDNQSVFLVQSALDDPSIQNFLTQPDIHWGFPTALETAGDMALSAPWLFE
jgi:proline utilization trans-activator